MYVIRADFPNPSILQECKQISITKLSDHQPTSLIFGVSESVVENGKSNPSTCSMRPTIGSNRAKKSTALENVTL